MYIGSRLCNLLLVRVREGGHQSTIWTWQLSQYMSPNLKMDGIVLDKISQLHYYMFNWVFIFSFRLGILQSFNHSFIHSLVCTCCFYILRFQQRCIHSSCVWSICQSHYESSSVCVLTWNNLISSPASLFDPKLMSGRAQSATRNRAARTAMSWLVGWGSATVQRRSNRWMIR